MPELALREPPAGARGLFWAPQPWVGTEVGTTEPGLGKGVGCGAHVCRGPCTQGLPARWSHPGWACLWSCRRPAEPVPFFPHSHGIKAWSGMLGRSTEAWAWHTVVPGQGCCHHSTCRDSPKAGPREAPHLPSQNAVVWVFSDCHVCCPIGHSSRLARHTALPCNCGSTAQPSLSKSPRSGSGLPRRCCTPGSSWVASEGMRLLWGPKVLSRGSSTCKSPSKGKACVPARRCLQPWHCPAPLQDRDGGQGTGASTAVAWTRDRDGAGGPTATQLQLCLLDAHRP